MLLYVHQLFMDCAFLFFGNGAQLIYQSFFFFFFFAENGACRWNKEKIERWESPYTKKQNNELKVIKMLRYSDEN